MSTMLQEELWKNWNSVHKCPITITRVEDFDPANGVYLYSIGNDWNGLLTQDRLITDPVYTPCFKIVSREKHIAILDKYGIFPQFAKKVFVDYLTGEVIYDGFTATSPFHCDEEEVYFKVGWENPEWFVFNCNERTVARVTA